MIEFQDFSLGGVAQTKSDLLVVQGFLDNIEDVLRNRFGTGPKREDDSGLPRARISGLAGKLSIYPHLVDPNIDFWKLTHTCGRMSREMSEWLKFQEIHAPVVRSDVIPEYDHVYLATPVLGVEVLFDGAIGQYLIGHNHAFVGTREQLRKLVLEESGVRGKKYRYSEELIDIDIMGNEPEKIFITVWGDRSVSAKDQPSQVISVQEGIRKPLDFGR